MVFFKFSKKIILRPWPLQLGQVLQIGILEKDLLTTSEDEEMFPLFL